VKRRALLEIGKKLWMRGLVSGSDGNLSIRISRDRILTTASGIPKGELREEHLLELKLDGTVITRSKWKPSSEIKMHLIVYSRRPEINAVCHAHPPYATAFAVAGIGMTSCVIPEIIVSLGAVPLAPYGTPSTEEVPSAIENFITDSDALLLANHGALTLGKTIEEAYLRMESIDHSAHIILNSIILGGPKKLTREDVEKLYATRIGLGFDNPVPRCK